MQNEHQTRMCVVETSNNQMFMGGLFTPLDSKHRGRFFTLNVQAETLAEVKQLKSTRRSTYKSFAARDERWKSIPTGSRVVLRVFSLKGLPDSAEAS